MYNIWENALADIEQKVSSSNFITWFKDTKLISSEGGHIIIGTKNSFASAQLNSKFLDIIKDAIKNTGTEVSSISFEILSTNKSTVQPREVTTVAPSKPVVKASKISNSIPSNGLNSKYTLDNYIIGSNNDVAAAAAQSIIEAPGTRYNPFFLYGGPGLGKTHLVQAIGNELVKRNPDFKVSYLPINEFYQDFIHSILNKNGKSFSDKYQKLDCLIIDDFQQIIGKEKSQEEFFNIFNHLHQLNKQIIVTSDRLPSQIKSVDERLASRLTMGGAFDIQLPKFEDKCAILRTKADLLGQDIEDEAIEYIAENVNTNIRDLERELSQLLLLAEVRHVTPLEIINSGAAHIENTSRSKTITSKQIKEAVAKEYNVTVKEICGGSRVAHIKTARQVVIHLLITELHMSTNKVAEEVCLKNHTSIMHSRDKIAQDLKLDFTLREHIDSIKEKLYA